MHKPSKELDRKSLERIYEVYFRSKLEYANTVLNDSFKHDKNAFQKLPTASSKYNIVTGAKTGTSHRKLYGKTGWLKLKGKREKPKLSFMYQIVHKKLPQIVFVEIIPNTINSKQLRNYGN